MRNFPLQTIFLSFFFTVLSSVVLKISKLELFFKKINSAIANHFGYICS